MACDVQTIIDGITRQLAGNSPCEDSLLELIPVYWELTSAEGCYSNYIHMLLTKRETILAMMGCEATSVDSYDKHRVMDGRTVGGSTSTLRSQSQSTGNSTRYSVGHGETRYDESNLSRSRGDIVRRARASEVGDGTSNYRDDGRGGGFNNSGSVSEIDSVETNLVQNKIDGGGEETGYTKDCNYEYSTNNTNGDAGGLPPIFIAGFSGTGSEWRKFVRTTHYNRDVSTTQTNWSHEHHIDDERRSRGSHGWSSFFQSDVEWHERDYEIRLNHDRSDTVRHSESHSHGDGDALSEDKLEGHNASQSTAKSEYKQEATRTSTKTDYLTQVTLANSQRFTNLQLLYDQLTQQIELAKKRYQSRAPAVIATLSCQCGSCCYCLGSFYANCSTQTGSHSASRMW